jgi:hypothetical protein
LLVACIKDEAPKALPASTERSEHE